MEANGVYRVTVQGYFTSDSLGLDVSPSLSIVTSDPIAAGKFAQNSADMRPSGVAEFLRLPPAGDWRPMSREEVTAYEEGEAADDEEFTDDDIY